MPPAPTSCTERIGLPSPGVEPSPFGRTHLPAAVDDFLRAPLNLGVAALHRSEIEVGVVAAGGHRTGGAATEADQHARATELDQQRAGRQRAGLERLAGGDVADAAGEHDRLVVTTHERPSPLPVSCS
jgi:hypothetical protein